MDINIAGLTDIGRSRNENQDAIRWFRNEAHDFAYLLVADGMGGYTGGAVAAQALVGVMGDALEQLAARPPGDSADMHRAVNDIFQRANRHILDLKLSQPRLAQMGTTAVLALIYQGRMVVAHVGDSRAYLWQGPGWQGPLQRLTRDHSVVQELIDSGAISAAEAENSQQRNMLTRAIGIDPTLEISIEERELDRDCLLLLCSDGLTGHISDEAIAAELSHHLPVLESCYRLVDAANQAGGRDNISVVIAEIQSRR